EVHLRYGSDALGSPPQYVANQLPQVDLAATVSMKKGNDTTDIYSRIDRLPREIDVDIASKSDGSGRIDYRAKADGHKPDTNLIMRRVRGGKISNVFAYVEGLPPALHGLWKTPPGGAMSGRFTTVDPDSPAARPDDGIGIGSLEFSIASFDGQPTLFSP